MIDTKHITHFSPHKQKYFTAAMLFVLLINDLRESLLLTAAANTVESYI